MHLAPHVQPSGSPRVRCAVALRNATLALAAVAGCARGNSGLASDAAPFPDGPAHQVHDGPTRDAPPRPDAATDAAPPCAISAGYTPPLTGIDDIVNYPASQQTAPGAMLGSDNAAISWDPQHLYVTVQSSAFTDAYEPLHIYVEAGSALEAATPSSGKEYSGLTAALPFTPTHLIAARQVDDSGSGPYDGVWLPGSSWSTRATPLAPGTDVLLSSDHTQLSVIVPWAALGGCPTTVRLDVHVVHAVPANEWKDLIPSTHTPWQAPGGGYYEIDLTGSSAIASWTLH